MQAANLFRYYKKKNFEIGDIIRYSKAGRVKFGKIVSFVHPDEIFPNLMKKVLTEKTFWNALKSQARAD